MRARRRRLPDGNLVAATIARRPTPISPPTFRAVDVSSRKLGPDPLSTTVATLDFEAWQPIVSNDETVRYARDLESGGVLVLPRLAFALTRDEAKYLDVRWSDGKAKNISLEHATIKGAQGSASDLAAIAAMVARFATHASGLVARLFPRYAPYLKRARTSYRPHPASGRAVSWRKDDARLHVDAFPSRPNHGERILRVFCNVNPHGEDRVWRVGEPFEAMATRLLPRVRRMLPGEGRVLHALHVTKSRRSDYDHLMLGLHDAAKADRNYQANSPQREVRFVPGTTWICFSDQVMHAASSGQFMFEQTIHLPIEALYEPQRSPLAVLERVTGRRLVTR